MTANGRIGMIVPLSLGFSQEFTMLRNLIYREYSLTWFSSFGRIPSALFNHDVRVRNTIYIAKKSKSPDHKAFSTRLHRWYEEERPYLLEGLEYAEFSLTVWNGRVPKIGSNDYIRALESAFAAAPTSLLSLIHTSRTRYPLYYKPTAYNWLAFSFEPPPTFSGDGRPENPSQLDAIYFRNDTDRIFAFLYLNGKLAFNHWMAVGDDFHVTKGNFESLPIPWRTMPDEMFEDASAITTELVDAMGGVVNFKLNAGKRIGSFNLARCRHVTDRSDRLLAEALDLDTVWEAIELYYDYAVKTDFHEELP